MTPLSAETDAAPARPPATASPAPAATLGAAPGPSDRVLLMLFTAAIAIRWLYSAIRQLGPDEAYYWVWSRHLSLSYFDHPPMVAYIIRLGTLVLGNTELGVRWTSAILGIGAVAIVVQCARWMRLDARAVWFVALMLIVSPIVSAIGSIVTPDTPACFFQAAALACAMWIFAPPDEVGRSLARGPAWLLFGLFMGLSLLSKYTSVLTGAAVFLALISSAAGRRHLRTPWPWVAAILACTVFSPVIVWNAQHQWSSFRFQLLHGMGQGDTPWTRNLIQYVGGQFAIATPVFFVLTIIALAWSARRWLSTSMHIRLLFLACIVPLLFFAYSSLHKRVEANWPMFAYFPGTLLVAAYVAQTHSRRREFWAGIAMKVALAGTIVAHLPEAAWAINPKWSSPRWDEFFGWRQLADKIEHTREGAPVFSNDYQYASELSFYLPGHPEIWPLEGSDRPTAFDYFPNRPKTNAIPRLVFVRKALKELPQPAIDPRLRQSYAHVEIVGFDFKKQGRVVRQSWIMLASK